MKGITFGTKHSYTDLSLVLNSKQIETPKPKTEKVNVPGADGELDFTEYFGGVKYENRTLKFVFTYVGATSNFPAKFSEIENEIHGKKLNIVLDDDSNFHYVGRVTVDDWKDGKRYAVVTISADCEPYKYKNTETVVTKSITTSGTVSLTNLKKPVVPKISTNAAITVSWLGGSASLAAGNDQLIPELILGEGITTLTITGTANVTFKYTEGGL